MNKDDLYYYALEGSMLSFDPSSGGVSMPGWALWSGGELLHSGIIEVPKSKNVYERYVYISQWIKEFMPVVNLLAIEQVSKGWRLTKSEGVIVGAVDCDHVLPVTPRSWQSTLRRHGVEMDKSDENDAIAVGYHAILRGRE